MVMTVPVKTTTKPAPADTYASLTLISKFSGLPKSAGSSEREYWVFAMQIKEEIKKEELEYIREKEERGELFVIRPPKKIEVSKVERDRQRLLAAYRMGRETMKEHMRSLERFLK